MDQTYRSVKRSIVIKASPHKVWRALTVPEERNRWETKSCTLELRVGGLIELDYGWGVSYTGTVKEIVPEQRLVLVDEQKELTIWTLKPHPDGTEVGIEYTGLWSGHLGIMEMENMAYGTYRFMNNMRSVLEHEEDLRAGFWKSWIGVNHLTFSSNQVSGIKVVEVAAGSPADGTLQVNDIVTELNGVPIVSYDEWEEAITSMEPHESAMIRYWRDGSFLQADIEVLPYGQKHTTAPANPGK